MMLAGTAILYLIFASWLPELMWFWLALATMFFINPESPAIITLPFTLDLSSRAIILVFDVLIHEYTKFKSFSLISAVYKVRVFIAKLLGFRSNEIAVFFAFTILSMIIFATCFLVITVTSIKWKYVSIWSLINTGFRNRNLYRKKYQSVVASEFREEDIDRHNKKRAKKLTERYKEQRIDNNKPYYY